MSIGPVDIAIAATSMLAPYLPQIIEGAKVVGEKITTAALGELSKQAFAKAKDIWSTLRSRGDKSAKVQEAAELLAKNEKDTSVLKEDLAKAILELISNDHELSESLLRILGNESGIQEVRASDTAWVVDVTMNLSGGGTQSVKASEDSRVKNINMTKK
jgi:hypothetical protein